MAKKPGARRTAGRNVGKAELPDGLVNAAPVSYPVARTTITALQVYHNPERRPAGRGPWDDEADKVAWIDDETGLGCIMLRQADGTISGYVGVGPEHPLFGFRKDAVPVDVSNAAHGGVTYARACEANRFGRVTSGSSRKERYTVCHTSWVRTVPDYRTVQTTEDEFGHEDLWWLGFDTSHPGDLVPKARHREQRKGDVYRDQGFVYANCIALARRLRSLAVASPDDDADTSAPLRLPPPIETGGADR